jgi:hypothetical protein
MVAALTNQFRCVSSGMAHAPRLQRRATAAMQFISRWNEPAKDGLYENLTAGIVIFADDKTAIATTKGFKHRRLPSSVL